MGGIYGAVMVLTFAVSAVNLARVLSPPRTVDLMLITFLVGSAEILLSGYVLSALVELGSSGAWAAAGLLWLAVSVPLAGKRRNRLAAGALSAPHAGSTVRIRIGRLSAAEQVLYLAPAVVVVGLGIVNLVNALFVAPNTVDGLTYHLPRVGYYLDQGHLGYFEANYSGQVVQAKGSAVLNAWAFLAADRCEGAMLLIQYVCYWIGLTSVYGICRRLGTGRRFAGLGACLFGLLPITLTQAPAPMSDLVVAAYVGCAVYFLVAYRCLGGVNVLFWAGVAFGMAAGVKVTALVAGPALAVVAWSALGRQHFGRGGITLAGSTLFGLALFTLPAGYAENYVRFGDPFTPSPALSRYSLLGKELSYVLTEGPKNVLRLGLEFLSLDGLPPVEPVRRLQRVLRLPAYAAGRVLRLEDAGNAAIPGFAAYRDPRAREEHSYWGVLGFGLLWIVPWVAVRGTSCGGGPRHLAMAAIVYLLTVAFTAEYDPWRGRLFMAMGMFAIPAVVCFLRERPGRRWRLFLLAVVLAGCLSAISAVIFRDHARLVSVRYGERSVSSIFLADRAGQMTSYIPRYAEAVRRFEAAVPSDATVAIYGDYMFEYVFFGPRMTRRLVPLGDGRTPMRPLPEAADFLVFSSKSMGPAETDEHLGQDWYLRRMRSGGESS